MKKVEYWRWYYRDAQTGEVCRSTFQMTAEEASRYPGAQRIEGSMTLHLEDDPEFDDTTPEVRSVQDV